MLMDFSDPRPSNHCSSADREEKGRRVLVVVTNTTSNVRDRRRGIPTARLTAMVTFRRCRIDCHKVSENHSEPGGTKCRDSNPSVRFPNTGLEAKGEIIENQPSPERELQVPISNEGKKGAWVSEYKVQL
jgi:hypothetical protein